MLTENLLKLRDISPTGQVLYEFSLPFKTRRVQLADIIAERVRHEVAAFESAEPGNRHALFQVDEVEKLLNGPIASASAKLDIARQVKIALTGFSSNRFFVIVDDVQAESLEQWLDIGDSPDVRFLKLVPLEGG